MGLMVSGCGGAQVAADESEPRREMCPAAAIANVPAPPTIDPWYVDRERACPAGATLEGMPPPMGDEVVCVKPGGEKHGRWTWWFDDKRFVSDGVYRDGEPDGEWVAWHPNGNRKLQGRYAAGKKQGRWIGWHENGQPSTDIHFEDGVEHGPWSWWNDNGSKAGEGAFRHGKPHGKWVRCDDSGTVTKIEMYEDDALVDWSDFVDGVLQPKE
jgi:hypothetical protein